MLQPIPAIAAPPTAPMPTEQHLTNSPTPPSPAPSQTPPAAMPEEVYPVFIDWLAISKFRRCVYGAEIKHALLRTCTAMRDLVADRFSARVDLVLPMTPESRDAASAKLTHSCKVFKAVQLKVTTQLLNRHPSPSEEEVVDILLGTLLPALHQDVPVVLQAAASALGKMALDNITRLYLYEMPISTLVSQWLPGLCPNIMELVVFECALATQPDALDTQPCATLPHVQRVQVCFVWPHLLPPSLVWLHHQLAALPAIKDLHLDYSHSVPLPLPPKGPLGSVTNLTISRGYSIFFTEEMETEVFSHLAEQFPGLRQIDFESHTALRQGPLAALLAVPPRHLEKVHSRAMSIETDMSDAIWPSKLCLTLETVDLNSLSKLPASSVVRVNCRGTACIRCCATSSPTAASRLQPGFHRLVAGSQHGRDTLELVPCWQHSVQGVADKMVQHTAELITTLPLFATLPSVHSMHLAHFHLSASTIQQVCDSIPPNIRSLHLEDLPTLQDAGVLTQLVASLPRHVYTLHVRESIREPEQMVPAMCSAASRPFRVIVGVYKALDEISAAVMAAGGGRWAVTRERHRLVVEVKEPGESAKPAGA